MGRARDIWIGMAPCKERTRPSQRTVVEDLMRRPWGHGGETPGQT